MLIEESKYITKNNAIDFNEILDEEKNIIKVPEDDSCRLMIDMDYQSDKFCMRV